MKVDANPAKIEGAGERRTRKQVRPAAVGGGRLAAVARGYVGVGLAAVGHRRSYRRLAQLRCAWANKDRPVPARAVMTLPLARPTDVAAGQRPWSRPGSDAEPLSPKRTAALPSSSGRERLLRSHGALRVPTRRKA